MWYDAIPNHFSVTILITWFNTKIQIFHYQYGPSNDEFAAATRFNYFNLKIALLPTPRTRFI